MRVNAGQSDPDKKGGEFLDWQSREDEGKYHLIIDSIDKSFDDPSGSAKVIFEVAAGPEGREGKKCSDFFSVFNSKGEFNESLLNKCMTLVCAAGLMTREAWKAAHEAGEDLDINEQDLVGRSICGELKFSPEDKAKGYKAKLEMGYRIYDPTDPTTAEKGFPINQQVLAAEGRATAGGKPANGSAKKNGSAAPATATAAPAPASDFGDMFK